MENNYFVKFKDHSQEFYELIRQRPTAFVLLAIIADRARKAQLTIDDGLEIGEAKIGDYITYGATEQSYRTDKKLLTDLKIITTRTTNRGTIAKIVNSSIFDISRTSLTNKLTDNQQPINKQATTKQEVRSERQEYEKGNEELMEKINFSHTGHSLSHLNEKTTTAYNKTNAPAPDYRKNFTVKGKVGPAYWDTYAPKIAYKLEIDPNSSKGADIYDKARTAWLNKGQVATTNSIETFLTNARKQSLADMDEYFE